MEALFALEIETSNPLMGALATDPHCFGDVSDWPVFIANTTDKQPTTLKRQTSITVRHEDLLVCEVCKLHNARRSSPSQGSVTNVSAEYS